MINNPIKKVAAIHDLSGFGRASLTVIIPILSSMGIQVCPLPTAVLSTHGKFKGYHFADLTEHMQPIIDHWKGININFDAIYSGFLGSPKQADIIKEFIETFRSRQSFVVIDPVLGDNGKTYGVVDDLLIDKMKELVKQADVITPNLTEAALLLDKKYPKAIRLEEIKEWILQLAEIGPKYVIVTSVPERDKPTNTSVVAYEADEDRFWKVSCSYLPANFPGTGDAFASVITGALLQGDSLPIALDRAVHFTSYGVRATFGYHYAPDEGILLEKVLKTLDAPIQLSSYEII